MQPATKRYTSGALALHGFTGCGSDFDCMRYFFPDTFFETPDLCIGGVPENFRTLLEELTRRFESLPKDFPRILIGYSMGGRIALHLALSLSRRNAFRENDRILLISASPGLDNDAERRARREHDARLAQKILSAPDAESFYEFWQDIPIIASQKNIPEPWKSRILKNRAAANKTDWARSLEILGTGTLPSLWGNLGEIICKTFLVCGENDEKFLQIARRMCRLLPQATLVEVPHCGHAPQLENPETFCGMIRNAFPENPAPAK